MGQFKNPRASDRPEDLRRGTRNRGDRGKGLGETKTGLAKLKGRPKFEGLYKLEGLKLQFEGPKQLFWKRGLSEWAAAFIWGRKLGLPLGFAPVKTAMWQFKNPRGKRPPQGFTKENRHWGDRGKGLGKTKTGLAKLKGRPKFEGLYKLEGLKLQFEGPKQLFWKRGLSERAVAFIWGRKLGSPLGFAPVKPRWGFRDRGLRLFGAGN